MLHHMCNKWLFVGTHNSQVNSVSFALGVDGAGRKLFKYNVYNTKFEASVFFVKQIIRSQYAGFIILRL